jgi:hypothetical protein
MHRRKFSFRKRRGPRHFKRRHTIHHRPHKRRLTKRIHVPRIRRGGYHL